MGVRTKPLGAYDCEGCFQGWHVGQVDVERCEKGRVARLTDRVASLRRGVSELRFTGAQRRLQRRVPPRPPA